MRDKSFWKTLGAAALLGFGINTKSVANEEYSSDILNEAGFEVVSNYYSDLRKEGKNWYGRSDARDVILREFYNSYVRKVIERGDTNFNFFLIYKEDEINFLKSFSKEFESFITTEDISELDKKNMTFFYTLNEYIQKALIFENNENKIFITHKDYLEKIEKIASNSSFYNSANFKYVKNFNRRHVEVLKNINKMAEEIEIKGESVQGKPAYHYGNIKLATKRLLNLYSIYKRFEYIDSFVKNPKISEDNLIIENLPSKERNKILYSKEGFSFPILDLGKKNQSLMNLIIEIAKRENISLQLVLVIALKENNFGNNFVSLNDAFGPMQIKTKPFFDMMGKNIEDYAQEDKFFASLEAGIKYLAHIKDTFNIPLDFNQKIPKTTNISKLSKKEKEVLSNYLRVGSLYYSGIGNFLLREADGGLTPSTLAYLEKLTSSLGYFYHIKNESSNPSIYVESTFL